jgi:hypothetical protein
MVDVARAEGVSVSDFQNYVKQQVFPRSLHDLEHLQKPGDVRLWRRQHLRELAKMVVTGETF